MPRNVILRVKPDGELFSAIKSFCEKNRIHAALITHLVGSLTSVKLSFLKTLPANYITREFKGPLEIVAGQGSIGTMVDTGELVLHIHLLVSDEDRAIGGHLAEGRIFSTAEVFIQELQHPIRRYVDGYTGLRELKE